MPLTSPPPLRYNKNTVVTLQPYFRRKKETRNALQAYYETHTGNIPAFETGFKACAKAHGKTPE